MARNKRGRGSKPGNPPGPHGKETPYAKATEAEMAQRISDVYELLLCNETRAGIVRHAAKEWNVSARQADTYIARATQQLDEEISVERRDLLARHIGIRAHLYQRALTAKDLPVCASVLKDQARLLGLYFNDEDMIRELLSRGYIVYEPDSPEAQAANSEAEATGHTAVIVETASVTDDGTPESETV